MTLSGSMQAARFYGPGDLKVESVEIPKVGPGEILVRSNVVLTCGTDVKMYKRGHPFAKPPLIIGHEFAGDVVDIGAGVVKFGKGSQVVAANSAPCGTCYYCRIHRPNLCDNLDDTIIGFTRQGAYAGYVVVPERIARVNTHRIPAGVSFEQAAFLEPLACVVHGNELAQIRKGDVVALIGGGPIGLLHLQMAKLNSAGKLLVCDISDQRLSEALEMGADEIMNTSKADLATSVREQTDGRGADVVIEAVGRPETWTGAVAATRKGGTVVLFGGCPPGTVAAFDAEHVHYGELTVRGSFHHTPTTVKRALELIATKKVSVDPIITARMGLSKVEDALKAMGDGRVLKVALDPSS